MYKKRWHMLDNIHVILSEQKSSWYGQSIDYVNILNHVNKSYIIDIIYVIHCVLYIFNILCALLILYGPLHLVFHYDLIKS